MNHVIIATRQAMINVPTTPVKIFNNLVVDTANFYDRKTNEILFESLKKCNKTALALPNYLSIDIARQLQRFGMTHVSIGKETFVMPVNVFEIKGQIPPFVVKRLGGMAASGIVDWAMRVVQNDWTLQSWGSFETLTKPNLEGNIRVIFILLLASLGLGIVSFACEKCGKIYYYFKKCYLSFVTILKNMWGMQTLVLPVTDAFY